MIPNVSIKKSDFATGVARPSPIGILAVITFLLVVR